MTPLIGTPSCISVGLPARSPGRRRPRTMARDYLRSLSGDAVVQQNGTDTAVLHSQLPPGRLACSPVSVTSQGEVTNATRPLSSAHLSDGGGSAPLVAPCRGLRTLSIIEAGRPLQTAAVEVRMRTRREGEARL